MSKSNPEEKKMFLLPFFAIKCGTYFKEHTTYAPLDNSARTILKKRELG
jgi:hypothetical protein